MSAGVKFYSWVLWTVLGQEVGKTAISKRNGSY